MLGQYDDADLIGFSAGCCIPAKDAGGACGDALAEVQISAFGERWQAQTRRQRASQSP